MNLQGIGVFRVAAAVFVIVAALFAVRIAIGLRDHAAAPPASTAPPPAAADPDTAGFALYRNDTFGYEIAYPAKWSYVEARPRRDTNAEWAGAILLDSELQKVTFRESEAGISPGEFKARIVLNPLRWTIDTWIRAFRVLDITGDDLVEETGPARLAGRDASRAKIMLFDHDEVELAVVSDGGILCLSFADAENLNDPLAREHARIYARMAETLRLLR